MEKFGDTDFYKNLKKPPFQPPSWLFRPVWSVIYFLLFVSLTLIIIAPENPNKVYAYVSFAIQLILNFTWMPVFFREQKICSAFVISLLLFVSVIAMMFFYFKISVIASLLLVPYLLWALFATILNFYICDLN